MRVIDENGGNLGIMSLAEALDLAQSKNLDLVEIVNTANPPVVKICNYGKFLYQQEKTEKKQKAKERTDEIKHIRLTFNIGKHDMEVRARQTEEFLKQGLKAFFIASLLLPQPCKNKIVCGLSIFKSS